MRSMVCSKAPAPAEGRAGASRVAVAVLFAAMWVLVGATQVAVAQGQPIAAPAGAAPSGTAPAADAANPAGSVVKVELNKLEDMQASCRAYLVVNNATQTAYDSLKLDLVMFQKDGIIGRRFAIDLAPLRASKTSVKLFDLDTVKCDGIGSFLINDVLDCKVAKADVAGCLDRLQITSRTAVELTK